MPTVARTPDTRRAPTRSARLDAGQASLTPLARTSAWRSKADQEQRRQAIDLAYDAAADTLSPDARLVFQTVLARYRWERRGPTGIRLEATETELGVDRMTRLPRRRLDAAVDELEAARLLVFTPGHRGRVSTWLLTLPSEDVAATPEPAPARVVHRPRKVCTVSADVQTFPAADNVTASPDRSAEPRSIRAASGLDLRSTPPNPGWVGEFLAALPPGIRCRTTPAARGRLAHAVRRVLDAGSWASPAELAGVVAIGWPPAGALDTDALLHHRVTERVGSDGPAAAKTAAAAEAHAEREAERARERARREAPPCEHGMPAGRQPTVAGTPRCPICRTTGLATLPWPTAAA